MLSKDEGRMMNDEFCYGEDFTGETVRLVREKEVRLYGDVMLSTSTLVLDGRRGMGKVKDEGDICNTLRGVWGDAKRMAQGGVGQLSKLREG
jgi:hypothetical protein